MAVWPRSKRMTVRSRKDRNPSSTRDSIHMGRPQDDTGKDDTDTDGYENGKRRYPTRQTESKRPLATRQNRKVQVATSGGGKLNQCDQSNLGNFSLSLNFTSFKKGPKVSLTFFQINTRFNAICSCLCQINRDKQLWHDLELISQQF